ncbi:MAG TPA: hypothetical protein VHR45_13805 [Thermoanaerobaculia bacterium]|nr:hypothetical protein [Thermoanaerobaculia bacterium]
MGKLPHSAPEVRLAVTLFLLLLGAADFFGAWQVSNFAAFTPAATAAAVAPGQPDSEAGHAAMPGMSGGATTTREEPVDLAALDRPHHLIDHDLLVQDTHVHLPAYALTAAALALIVFGLALRSRTRVTLVVLAFASPAGDFAGLWGAHLFPRLGAFFGGVAVVSGFAMGLVYLIVLVLALFQCWLRRPAKEIPHA